MRIVDWLHRINTARPILSIALPYSQLNIVQHSIKQFSHFQQFIYHILSRLIAFITALNKQLIILPIRKMEAMTENYQLKWHAFGTHLHSCVAASLSMRQFTDVCLATMDGYQIAAHRFILSACSRYLHDILKMHYNAISSTLSPVLIILPSEISSKSLKVLMEYMYSGKATVSKDVLENVLRGGDLLKIKGLWRPKDDDVENLIRVKPSDNLQNNQGFQDDKRIRQKNDPTSSKMLMFSSSMPEVSSNTSTINLPKKPMLQPSVIKSTDALKKTTINNEFMKGTKQIVENSRKIGKTSTTNAILPPNNLTTFKQWEVGDTEQLQSNLVIKEEPTELNEDMEVMDQDELYTNVPTTGTICNDSTTEMTIKPEIMFESDDDEDDDMRAESLVSMVDAVTMPLPPLVPFINIARSLPSTSSEIPIETHASNDSEGGELYTPLMCELCSETFTLPKDWVKHVQKHTDVMPAKRQRRGRNSSEDESSNTFPPLQCDLCQMYFATPAEWVQHIERSHTITELRFSNVDKSNEAAVNNRSSKRKEHIKISGDTEMVQSILPTSGQQKECPVCKKSFPSHASMMIHSRTHTGERPYNCDYCCKGFNVKSNLLRHLRTLHNKIINSVEIENKELDNI